MFELDGVYDQKLRDGIHKVNLGIRIDGVVSKVATGTNAHLPTAVFEAVSKAVSAPLLEAGFTHIPVPSTVEYSPEEARISLGSITEEVEGNSVEDLARAYLCFVLEMASRFRETSESQQGGPR